MKALHGLQIAPFILLLSILFWLSAGFPISETLGAYFEDDFSMRRSSLPRQEIFPLRIMPLGASITTCVQSNQEDGYRKRL